MVYVISKDGKPLMPAKRHGKVRRLLKQSLAKVVRRDPFTIQLLYDTTTYTQPVTVGVDIGSKTVGISAITENQELLSMEVELRQDIKKLLLERREYRRNRRYRKRRYRKPRFLNRHRYKGWLAPSVQWKIDAHIRLVNLIAKILPVTRVVIEISPFDTHKIVNPDVEGNQYQEGLQKGKIKIPRSRLEKVKILKDASHVAAIGWHIVNRLKQQYDVEITFGSITKTKRIEMGLEKTHRNDAFVIAGGSKDVNRATEWYLGKFFRRQNRSLYKANPIKSGKRPINTVKEVYGFKKFDKVEYQDKTGIILGLRSSGYFAIGSLTGEKIIGNIKYSELRLLEKAKTLMFERREERIPLHLTEDGVSCAQQR